MLGYAADNEMRDAVATVRFHDDEVSVYVFCRLGYRAGDFGLPREMRNKLVFDATEMLVGDALQLP